MTTEPIDVREIPVGYHATRRLAADLGGACTVLGVDGSLQQRLITAGDYTRGADGRWRVSWRDTFTVRAWDLDADQVSRQIVDRAMLGPGMAAPPRDRIEAITAALISDLDAREAAAAAPVPPDDRLTVAAAVAGWLLRDREAWSDLGGVWWRRVDPDPDPVLGGGRDVATPAGRDGWAARLGIGHRTVPGAERVTPDTCRAAIERGSSYLQLGERIDDWSAVVHEIEALVARRP